jgi:hypothetical protein
MAAPDDIRLSDEGIVDELRARLLRNYDRAGDTAAITKHREEMLLRGAGPAELQQYFALVSVRITGRRGKPKGAQSLVRTKIGTLRRAEIGAVVFTNTGRALNPTRDVMKAAISKALVEFGVDREIIGKAYREYRKTEREREAERASLVEARGMITANPGMTSNPDAVIAMIDEKLANWPA